MWDELGRRDRFVERHADDLVGLERDHRPDPAVMDGIDGADPKAGGEDPVKCRWRTAPLYVTENGNARLDPGHPLDLCS